MAATADCALQIRLGCLLADPACGCACCGCRYKFCVAMENSIRQDYMTEKMWDALAAGCIPIYLGSKNAAKIIPDPNSIIM